MNKKNTNELVKPKLEKEIAKEYIKTIGFSFLFRKRKYKVCIVKTINNKPEILKIKNIKPNVNTISFRSKKIPINVNDYSHSRGNKLYYFIDIEKGQLGFNVNVDSNVNYELIDDILSKEIIKQIVATLRIKDMKVKIMNLILGLAIGTFAGLFIGVYFL